MTLAAVAATSSQFVKLRKITRVAMTWLNKRVGSAPSLVNPAGVDHKHYRRAFVAASLEQVACTRMGPQGLELHIAGELVATTLLGNYRPARSSAWVSFSPKSVGDMTYRITERFERVLVDTYAQLNGGVLKRTYHASFHQTHSRRMRGMAISNLKHFLSHVDAAARRCANSTGLPTAEMLEWLTPNCSQSALRRRQALSLYPVLLFNRLGDQQLTDLIDAGGELNPALAAISSRKAVRRLRGVTIQRAIGRSTNIESFLAAVKALGSLGDQHAPASKADFAALRRLAGMGVDTSPAALTCLLRAYKCPLSQTPLGDPLVPAQIDDTLRDLRDVLSGRLRGHSPFSAEAVVKSLVEGKSLAWLIRLCAQWHNWIQRETSQDDDESRRATAWPALLPGKLVYDGAEIHEITNEGALRDEGRSQQHCVGSFAPSCLQGRSRIVSIRTSAGATLSTAEIVRKEERLQVRQHHAARNAKPPAAAISALNRLLRDIGGKRVNANMNWPALNDGCEGFDQPPRLDTGTFWTAQLGEAAFERAVARARSEHVAGFGNASKKDLFLSWDDVAF